MVYWSVATASLLLFLEIAPLALSSALAGSRAVVLYRFLVWVWTVQFGTVPAHLYNVLLV